MLKVISYNVHEALGDPARSESVVRFLEAEQPDVAAIHSAYWTQADGESPRSEAIATALTESTRRLGELGYDMTVAGEKDTTGRPDKTGLVGIVRGSLRHTSGTMNLRTRSGFQTTVTDPDTGVGVRIGGVHITDTNEASRLEQVRELPTELDVLLSDANAMHRRSRIARTLRVLRPLTDRIPDFNGRDFNGARGAGAVLAGAHLLQSLVWMADGSTMDALAQRGFKDADSIHQTTVHLGRFGIGQFDHIHFDPATVQVGGYHVHRLVSGADHWPISAYVQPVAA